MAMELVNVYAIVDYGGKWIEMIMSLGFVVAAAVVTYSVVAILRLIVYGITRMIKKLTFISGKTIVPVKTSRRETVATV